MNAAKPVIVSDHVGAASDLVQNGINGFIYPNGNVSALADRLKSILELPAMQREQMGWKSLERINTWNFEADCQGLLAALSFVCQKKRQGGIAI